MDTFSVACILRIYILPSRVLLASEQCVEVGAIIVPAAKVLDTICIVDLQTHEDEMM